MNNLTKITAAIAVAFLISSSGTAHAGVIYSATADTAIPGTDTLQDSGDWNGTASQFGVVAGGTSAFTTNHYELTGNAGNFSFGNWGENTANLPLTTFSIDLTDTGGGGTNADAGVRFAARPAGGGSTFFDAVSVNLTDNAISTFHVVANNSGAPVAYADGVNTIADGTAEFWQDGVLIGTKTMNSANDIFSWGMWARRTDNQLFGDNIVIYDMAVNGIAPAAIPEPSSLALLGLAGMAGVLRRKRS